MTYEAYEAALVLMDALERTVAKAVAELDALEADEHSKAIQLAA